MFVVSVVTEDDAVCLEEEEEDVISCGADNVVGVASLFDLVVVVMETEEMFSVGIVEEEVGVAPLILVSLGGGVGVGSLGCGSEFVMGVASRARGVVSRTRGVASREDSWPGRVRNTESSSCSISSSMCEAQSATCWGVWRIVVGRRER